MSEAHPRVPGDRHEVQCRASEYELAGAGHQRGRHLVAVCVVPDGGVGAARYGARTLAGTGSVGQLGDERVIAERGMHHAAGRGLEFDAGDPAAWLDATRDEDGVAVACEPLAGLDLDRGLRGPRPGAAFLFFNGMGATERG